VTFRDASQGRPGEIAVTGIPHVLPQGYRRGFICDCAQAKAGAKRHFVMDLCRPPGVGTQFPLRQWIARSTRPGGREAGFYEVDSVPDPDFTFWPKEAYIPTLVSLLRASNYWDWTKHRRRLVRYAQMLYLRSRLFREEYAASRGLSTEACKGESIRVMLDQLRECPVPLARLKLQLLISRDCRWPFITSDCPVVMENTSPQKLSRLEAITDRFTYVIWPISWDMCLIGSVDPLPLGEVLDVPSMVDYARKLISRSAREFLISPHQLAEAEIDLP
jgi:hypothetical protein